MEPHPEPTIRRRVRPEAPPTRPGFVALAALLTEFVVIAAIGNQWVTPKLARAVVNERSHLVSDFKSSLVTYNWRFAPEQGDTQHVWLSQVLLILATLVLTAVFVTVIVRGPATLGRVFLTCWLAVTVATVFGGYARGLSLDTGGGASERVQSGLFGTFGPNTITVFSGLILGLLAALVAATATAVSRNRAALGPKHIPPAPVGAAAEQPYFAPEQPPPFNPIPRPGPGVSPGAPTAAFPRPPDDEDLGHDHHD
jgi:hypothetical protein